jgi:acetylornithine deacetylase/succinyl-diaminopimelate desuccinylase-like protein
VTAVDRVIELTAALVAFPTHEREADAQVFLASVLGAAGFDCRLQEIAPGRPNLIARRGSSGPFLCSHVDVHPPHDHPDPWTARLDGELLVGRGVLDAKGQVAAIVAACEAEPDADACVLITCDEEFTGLGSLHADIPDGPWTSEGGIVCEPTDFRVCTAQMGNVDVRIEASAPPHHAYSIEPGASPVHAILSAIETLDSCSFLKQRHPLLPQPRLNVGRITGGEHAWRAPARASLDATMGVVPGTELADAEREVTERLDELAERWAARGVAFREGVSDSSEPIEVPRDLAIVDRLGAGGAPAGMPSWTDAAYLLLHHGLPCVVFGAGELTTAHSDLEAVAVDDLVRLTETLRTVLRSYG